MKYQWVIPTDFESLYTGYRFKILNVTASPHKALMESGVIIIQANDDTLATSATGNRPTATNDIVSNTPSSPWGEASSSAEVTSGGESGLSTGALAGVCLGAAGGILLFVLTWVYGRSLARKWRPRTNTVSPVGSPGRYEKPELDGKAEKARQELDGAHIHELDAWNASAVVRIQSLEDELANVPEQGRSDMAFVPERRSG